MVDTKVSLYNSIRTLEYGLLISPRITTKEKGRFMKFIYEVFSSRIHLFFFNSESNLEEPILLGNLKSPEYVVLQFTRFMVSR